MVEKYDRTIDGMRVRDEEAPRRAVGFSNYQHQPNSMARPNNVRPKVSRPAPQPVSTQKADFGLDRSRLEAERATANDDFVKPVSTLDIDISSKELRPNYSLKKQEEAQAPRRGSKKHKLKNRRKSKKLVTAVLVLAFVGGGALAIWGNSLVAKLTGGKAGILDFIGAMNSNVKLKTDGNGRTNILVYGTSGYDMSGTLSEGEEHDGAQLTDSIMVISLDQESKDVAMVSLPRDLYVGNTCTPTGKVNEVFYCSNLNGDDEEGGANALKSAVSEIFDMELQYKVHVDWSALIQVVDGLGGITVTLDEDIEDDWTDTYIHAGEPTELNGDRALALARARHGTEMGDFTRGNSQQKILAAIQDKIVSQGLDLGTALNLIDAVGDNVRMDFSIEEIKTVYNIAKSMSLENLRQVPLIDFDKNIDFLSTAEMNEISYVVPTDGIGNYDSIRDYVHRMFTSDPAVRENARIVVLNGAGVAGTAMKEQSRLSLAGFTVIEVGDAPDMEYTDAYYLYDITGATPDSLRSLAERYQTEIRPLDQLPEGAYMEGADIVVIVGEGQF